MPDPREVWTAGDRELSLFCPRCVKQRPTDQSSCPECGEWLAPRGYCEVCESRWNLQVGALCPKHDIELAPDPPLNAFADLDEAQGRWVQVETYASAVQAEAARLRLEAEGIPAQLHGMRMATAYSWQIAMGGIRLVVPANLAQDARILISQAWSVPDEDEEADLGEIHDSAAIPEGDARDRSVREVAFWGALLVIVIVTAVVAI
jgi:hypothetical protein